MDISVLLIAFWSMILGYVIRKIVSDRKIAEYKDALRWCGGSADFNEGGKARIGWLKIAYLTK